MAKAIAWLSRDAIRERLGTRPQTEPALIHGCPGAPAGSTCNKAATQGNTFHDRHPTRPTPMIAEQQWFQSVMWCATCQIDFRLLQHAVSGVAQCSRPRSTVVNSWEPSRTITRFRVASNLPPGPRASIGVGFNSISRLTKISSACDLCQLDSRPSRPSPTQRC